MPNHPPLQSAASAITGRLAGALISLALLASATTTAGCGESTSPQAAASNPPNTTTQTTTAAAGAGASANTTSTATTAASATGTGAAGSAAHTAVRPARHGRVHLVLPPPGSRPEPKLSASQAANLPVSDILLSSPAIQRAGRSSRYTIAAQYTCHGADRSPPLHWSAIPAGTRELAIFVLSSEPVEGRLYYDWALAGLSPTLKGLTAGQLPPGAIPGQNSAGRTTYTLCPPAGKKETYVFQLYALPQPLHATPGFQPNTLRQQAKQISRHTGLLAGTNG